MLQQSPPAVVISIKKFYDTKKLVGNCLREKLQVHMRVQDL
jgi:hypothetical protein